jgi:hypothetical protein
MNKYTFSYNILREEQYLSPHAKWWRRWLGQKELHTKKVDVREHFTFEAVSEIAENDQWFHYVLMASAKEPITRVQLEHRHYPTSHIPTSDSPVTRVTDSYEGPLFGEIMITSGSEKFVTEKDGSISLLIEPSSTNYIRNSK